MSANEAAQQRRRHAGLRDDYDRIEAVPSESAKGNLYYVTHGPGGAGTFPTTGKDTVFYVALLPAYPLQDVEGSLNPALLPSLVDDVTAWPAINLGEAVPIVNQTIVRCDTRGGQLFFTYRGNGAAT